MKKAEETSGLSSRETTPPGGRMSPNERMKHRSRVKLVSNSCFSLSLSRKLSTKAICFAIRSLIHVIEAVVALIGCSMLNLIESISRWFS
ncbi:hypothetical protein Bca4012_038401 [Brassica carinata]|uniref:Uncharacterized protein n=1 Tax=Brassica carinata TaxID=52824 RepID=A0A8X7W8P2_BRACI|nr:hypothetical protein Bca52824_006771 [Brassica carinata]